MYFANSIFLQHSSHWIRPLQRLRALLSQYSPSADGCASTMSPLPPDEFAVGALSDCLRASDRVLVSDHGRGAGPLVVLRRVSSSKIASITSLALIHTVAMDVRMSKKPLDDASEPWRSRSGVSSTNRTSALNREESLTDGSLSKLHPQRFFRPCKNLG